MNPKRDLSDRWQPSIFPLRWQKFVYLGDPANTLQEDICSLDRPSDSTSISLEHLVHPLSTMQVGDRVRLVSLNCGEANSRLMGMGFVPGSLLQVISCTATGSVIVALQDQRLGLDAAMAKRIHVMDSDRWIDSDPRSRSSSHTKPMNTPANSNPIKLRDAAIGLTLKVVGYEPTARDYKRKLLAMGLTPGTEFVVKRHAPLGDPTELEVRGFRLSLRKAEAEALIVECI